MLIAASLRSLSLQTAAGTDVLGHFVLPTGVQRATGTTAAGQKKEEGREEEGGGKRQQKRSQCEATAAMAHGRSHKLRHPRGAIENSLGVCVCVFGFVCLYCLLA